MTTRKPAKPPAKPDAYLDAWRAASPRSARERAEAAAEYRLIELRQQAENDAMEPMTEFIDAFAHRNLDN